MEYSGFDDLINLEVGAPKYNHFLTKTFATILTRYGIEKHERVLDFGSGIGTLAVEMRDRYEFGVECLEIDNHQIEILQNKKFKVYQFCQEITVPYRAIYTSNVLEHIEDDSDALRQIYAVAKDDGAILVVYVPALTILFSSFDAKIGHWRRYQKRDLRRIVRDAGWRVTSVEYVDCLGIIGWLLQKYTTLLFKNANPSVELVKFYSHFIFPISRILDRLFMRHILGKNLLLIAEKV